MKKISLWLCFGFLGLLVITSCQKENIDTTTEKEEPITPTVTTVSPPANALLSRSTSNDSAEETGISFDCFTILFPFNLIDNHGNVHEVDSEEAFADLFETEWDTTQYIVDFEFPLNVMTGDDEEAIIENNEELAALFAECVPEGGWNETFFPAYLIDDENSCYKIVYPITLQDPFEEVLVTAEEETQLVDLLIEKDLYFHFPFSLTDGEAEIAIENVDQLFDVLFSCNEVYQDSLTWDYEEGFEYIYCYQVNFPLDVVVSNGEVKTVNNHQELCDLMLQGELQDYAYPLTLTNPEGEEVVANSEEELETLFQACEGGFIGDGEESDVLLLVLFAQPFTEDSTSVCYTINYPISGTYVDEDGTEQTIVYNSEEEVFNEIDNGNDWSNPVINTRLIYPVEVIRSNTGEVVTLDSLEDLFELAEACSDGL